MNPKSLYKYTRIVVMCLQVLLDFDLTNNTKLTPADDERTVVVCSDKPAVGLVSRASACADRFIP